MLMMCQYSNKTLKQCYTAKALFPQSYIYHEFAVTVLVYVIYTINGSVKLTWIMNY